MLPAVAAAAGGGGSWAKHAYHCTHIPVDKHVRTWQRHACYMYSTGQHWVKPPTTAVSPRMMQERQAGEGSRVVQMSTVT